MFSYIYNSETHTDTSTEYMQGLGLDQDTIDSILAQKQYEEGLWITKRAKAYKEESDALFIEWQYDGAAESEKAWRDKVAEIKARFPAPKESVE